MSLAEHLPAPPPLVKCKMAALTPPVRAELEQLLSMRDSKGVRVWKFLVLAEALRRDVGDTLKLPQVEALSKYIGKHAAGKCDCKVAGK